MSTLTTTVQSFFTTYLTSQKAASRHTITAYRDTFTLLLRYLHDATGITPDHVEFTDVNADTVSAFLDYLETVRGNTIRTRNARLAALHAFFSYAAYLNPDHAELIARVLAMKSKKTSTTILTYLTSDEADALLAAPDRATRTGFRDYTIIHVLLTTGLRVSELTALTCADLQLQKPAHLLCHGKGRKDRITPLDAATVVALNTYLARYAPTPPAAPVFTAQGSTTAISRDAIAARLRIHAATATAQCRSLANKAVTPHTLRHAAAMRMLEAGIDITTIALWLGHETTQATQAYIHADLSLKERAITRLQPKGIQSQRYTPQGQLLAFLEAL